MTTAVVLGWAETLKARVPRGSRLIQTHVLIAGVPATPFTGKAQWHAQQRQLSPREEIRILIELRREVESNGIRKSLGRPIVAMKPWDTRA